MRTKCLTLYTFDELSETAQQKAVSQLWDINVDYDWWEGVADDIAEFGDASGLNCAFGEEFDIDRASYVHITDCHTTFGELRENAPKAADFPNIADAVIVPFLHTFTPRETHQLLRLEQRGVLGILSGETSTNRRGIRADVERYDTAGHPRVCALLDKLEAAWKQLLRDLEHAYLTMLRDEYAYRTSEEQIIESIRAHAYEFLEDGTRA
jgi:hypothetical protein